MKEFLRRNKVDILAISFIVLVSLIVRTVRLDLIPSNISGDEVTNLSDVYRILFGQGYNFFSFMGDGSVAGINFYWSAFFVKVFGLNNAIFSLRFSIAILSVLSLIPFYLLLKDKTSQFFSFIFTLLLSANYVFLNFSRTAWVNMGIIFSGLFLILALEKAEKEERIRWYILAGIFAGVTLYGYHYGRVFVAGIFLYITFKLLRKRYRNFYYLKRVLLFLGSTMSIFMPFFLNIVSDQAQAILRRPSATYIFKNKVLGASTMQDLLRHQFEYTLRGFLLLDRRVMSEGIENMRYVPSYTPPVNTAIKIVFFLGLIYALIFERRVVFWWIILISVFLVQILSESPPNFSRGLFYIPFIYFICGLFIFFIYRIFSRLQKFLLFKKFRILSLFLLTIGVILFVFDLTTYFEWMDSKNIYNARQPAIDYKEFPLWEIYQIQRIKLGQYPMTNYEWYEIRKHL